MAKKGIPIFLQLLILLAAFFALTYGGHYLMKKRILLAKISLEQKASGDTIKIINEDGHYDWGQAVVYLNKRENAHPLYPLQSGEYAILQVSDFQGDIQRLSEVQTITIADMKGFDDRIFEVRLIQTMNY